MISVLLRFLLGVSTVTGLELVVTNSASEVVAQVAASTAGEYVFEELAEGRYTVQAVVRGTVVATVTDVDVPITESIEITVTQDSVEQPEQQQAEAPRNQNIQVNQIDNQALDEALARQGAQISPIVEFAAARGNYAVELGGIGRDPQIIRGDRRSAYHGEIYVTHNNHLMNARTFFQVGEVLPSRRNQYGFGIGRPLGSDKLSFVWTAEETLESGFVNGNIRVPLPSERTALAEDPELRALIQSWLDAYPKEVPNKPEIDPRMLNTDALQKIRNTGSAFRLDWNPGDASQFFTRYSINDTFIDSFEFIIGQNPNQRLRSQTLNLAWQQQLSPSTTLSLAANYLRRKVHLLVPPGSVGPNVSAGGEIDGLGPAFNMPIFQIGNDFQYLVRGATNAGRHTLDWGGQVVRSQLNELHSDGLRGVVPFRNNFGRSALENFRYGTATRYSFVAGSLYRAWRRTDVNLFVNDRIRLASGLDLTIGLRYELAGLPVEVHDLTVLPFNSDSNNFAPRIGLAYSRGRMVIRAGYGISYGDFFPATFRQGRLNPPDVIRADVQSPDLLDPLKDFVQTPGEIPRHIRNLLDPELVAPYMHQYTLQVEYEPSSNLRLRATYIGSRNWKLFQNTYTNRAERVDGIPLTTSTVHLRRPDQRFFTVRNVTNRGRAYFDAAQLSVDKVFSQGLALRATYTFSKALDTGTDFSNTGVRTPIPQVEELGLADLKARSRFDAPHSFLIGYSYVSPSWMGGLTLSGATILRDGTPFNVEVGTDSPPFGNVDGERNDRPSILDTSLLGASVDHPDIAQNVLRPEAFDMSAAFREGRGNLSRAAFRKDGTTNFNVSVSRSFAVPPDRTRTILIRAEFINAFNHPQFAAPTSNLTDPNFGQITNTVNAGRIVRFTLRFSF